MATRRGTAGGERFENLTVRGRVSNRRVASQRFGVVNRPFVRAANEGAFDTAMLIAERDFQMEHMLAMTLEAEMARLDDARMHRPHCHLVNLRAVHRYPLPHPRLGRRPAPGGSPATARKGSRRAWFGGTWHDTPLYERDRLPAGEPIAGPAIVEQADTTTIVPPGWTAVRDPAGNLLLARAR